MDDQYWQSVRSVRLAVADHLDALTDDEWESPSLCSQWRVADVAGHLASALHVRPREILGVLPRAHFDLNRASTLLARRYAAQGRAHVAAYLREEAGTIAPGPFPEPRNFLFDVVVHSQDVSLPLGRKVPVPEAALVPSLDRVWEQGWPFHARRRLAGLRVRATDVDWSVGEGPEVAGDALTLLLLTTGRTEAALPGLAGPGVAGISPGR